MYIASRERTRQESSVRATQWLWLARPLRLCGVLTALGAGWLVLFVTVGAVELRAGAHELESAQSLLPGHGSRIGRALPAVLTGHLVRAHSDFQQARVFLALPAPLLQWMGWLPGIGSDAVALAPAADAGFYATDAGLQLEAGVTPLLGTSGSRTIGVSNPRRILAVLAFHRSSFVHAEASSLWARAAVAALPSNAPALHGLKPTITRAVQTLSVAAEAGVVAPSLLGADGTRRYLFAWEDPMELRATGGFIGASDMISLRAGAATHRFSGRVPSTHEIDTALPPLPESAYTPETYWLFCDANWSPDFPVTARLERWFYGEDTGLWADGVVDFVDTGIVTILRATGPVYLPAYGRWVTAGNAESLAQQYINGAYKGPLHTGLRDDVRKQFFHHVMVALQARVAHLPIARWPAFGRAMLQLVRTRQVQIYSRNPGIQQAVASAGASGSLLRTSGDYLYVVDDNRSYNKINPYVHEAISLHATALPSGAIQHTLTVRYHVDPSPATLIGYGPGLGHLSLQPDRGPSLGTIGNKHDYADFVRVFVPLGSVLESTGGLERWAPQSAYGLTEFSGHVMVRSGQSAVVTFRYRTPASRKPYSLTVQHEPGSSVARVTVHLRQLRVHGITRTWRHPDGDLFIPSRASTPVSPSLSTVEGNPSIDPSIPFQSLHDAHHPV
jgi:hypothetical protein